MEKKVSGKVPYADTVIYFADEKTKRITTLSQNEPKKGWTTFKVGNKEFKSRNPSAGMEFVQGKNAASPPKRNISLFTSTSYHKPISGRISKYGTNDYNLDYSVLTSTGTYALDAPILNTVKGKGFGKTINRVRRQRWDYLVLDWKPNSDGTNTLFVTRKIISDDKSVPDKIVFKSKDFKESDKASAIKLFRQKMVDMRKEYAHTKKNNNVEGAKRHAPTNMHIESRPRRKRLNA